MIYLDNAATTKVSQEVLDEMLPYLGERYGNPGTVYSLGRQAASAVAAARQRVADFIGASPEQIIFTSGGSEANTIAIRCTHKHLMSNGKGVVLTSATEHDSILKAIEEVNHVIVGVDNKGVVDISEIETLLWKYPRIGMVSVMYVNNETGSVNSVKEIARVCGEYGVLFHTDCVQAAGCQRINVDEIGCDFLSLSSHKIHGVKGVGALYVKNKELLTPQIYGGALQEFGLRSGTENVSGIVAFGMACEIAGAHQESNLANVTRYKQTFYDSLKRELNEYGLKDIVSINGEPISSQGKTLNLRFENVDAETLMLMLDAQGIYISAGSACRSHESQPSHVLTAMGLTPDQARDSVRISFSEYNTPIEIEIAARTMACCINNLLTGYTEG